ncbi:MAG: lysophospholipid acyltransferase family protein, partial [bacterium]
FLARKLGVPVITLHSEPKYFWELKSWDQFRIPKPFTSALVKFGRPLQISAEEGAASSLARFQAEMDRIKVHCEEWREHLTV